MSSVTKDTKIWDELRKRLKDAGRRDAHVRVGVFESAGYAAPGFTMVELAAVHEFGSPAIGVPERSFIRRTLRKVDSRMTQLMAKLARGVIAEKLDISKALGVLGAWAVSEIQKTIRSNIPPPLKDETIKRKGGKDVALVDSGQLLNSITSVVK